MISGAYNTPASAWTQAIDAALVDWSNFMIGDHTISIKLVFDASNPNLAFTANTLAYVGELHGTSLFNLRTQADAQGIAFAGEDVTITINPSLDWSFSGEPNKYDAKTVMTHEIGHALFMVPSNGPAVTPFELWSNNHPGEIDGSGAHTNEHGLMYSVGYRGEVFHVTPDLARIAGASGTPTIFDDRIFLHSGGNIDAGAGVDTGVWLQSASTFNATLVNFEYVEFPSIDQLTDRQLSIWGLYQGLLDRSPDLGGFQWWDQSGLPLDGIAGGIRNSAEFKAMNTDIFTFLA